MSYSPKIHIPFGLGLRGNWESKSSEMEDASCNLPVYWNALFLRQSWQMAIHLLAYSQCWGAHYLPRQLISSSLFELKISPSMALIY